MDDYRILHSAVIESKYDELRRYFTGKDMSRLSVLEAATEYSGSIFYLRRAHDLPLCPDKGYISYFDEPRHRKIYVSTKAVGLSQAFHAEKGIEGVFHLIKKSNNHQHYSDMTPTTRQWWIDNMQFVALQVMETDGNVVLFCNNGRSRSPMYLVVYLVVMYSMSVVVATDLVSDLLLDGRGHSLDRHGCLLPIVELIDENDC